MLSALRIQNVVLIEKLDIEFQSGLCALTGETGAGKSILLDSLGLATGARADSGLVRSGTDQAIVSASFEVSGKHPSKMILEDQGLEFEQTLILRRVLNTDGRSKAFINDQPVSAGLLKLIGDSVLEVHGQFDTQGLLDPKQHRGMLDDYAGIDGVLEGYWNTWKAHERKLIELKEQSEKSKNEEEYLRTALEDLDALEPQKGEEEQLASLRESLMHREQVLEALNTAYNILDGENDPVRAAWSALDRVAGKMGAGANDAISALDRASSEIQEALSAIQSLSADLENEEHDLQSIDDRLFSLRGQARKHHCEVDDLPDIREKLAQDLNMIEHADDVLANQMRLVVSAQKEYETKALQIREQRKDAAQKLDALIAPELPPLKMDRAQFVTKVDPLEENEWGPYGMDRIRFLVATNPGAEPGPLNKIASGGEMSRFMLALKLVLSEVGSAGSLVFDEVDAGIGGSTADAVGERLARLAKSKQVLVVTHSPQVAARASHQWIVMKSGDDNVTTSVVPLTDNQQRREEIARMLSGAEITSEARAAADKLLESKAA